MTMTNKPDPARTEPTDYGFANSFDAEFGDLSDIKPIPRAKRPKPAPKSVSKPKPKKSKPAPKATRRVQTIAPAKPAVLVEREAASDRIAKSMGFQSREQAPMLLKKRRRTHHDEPVDQLSIRGPVRVLNDFITFCEGEGVSYWEGLQSLVEAQSNTSSKNT